MIQKCFTWPNISLYVDKYVKSCKICQKSNRCGQSRAQMIERPVVSEPFEVVAIDIVGSLPQGSNKYQYLLTTICMATRWPDVIPLKSITAKSVADALIGCLVELVCHSKLCRIMVRSSQINL